MIEMGKKYRTRDGRKVRVLCVDAISRYRVVGLAADIDGIETMESWTESGAYDSCSPDSAFNLIEVSSCEGWPIDSPIWVGNGHATFWWPRYFAGISQDGDIYAWESGGTSFSSNRKISWREARLASEFTPTAEERGDD